MPRFRLPHGATSVKMQDGSFYRASGSARRGAVVEVDNPAHVRAIRANGAVEGFYHEIDYTAPTTKGRTCPACEFSAYRWQKLCPKCGADTIEESE